MVSKFAFYQNEQWLKKWKGCGKKEKRREKKNKTEGQNRRVLWLVFSMNIIQIQRSEKRCVFVVRMQGITIQEFKLGIFLSEIIL